MIRSFMILNLSFLLFFNLSYALETNHPKELITKEVCPFECCHTKNWKVKEKTILYENPDQTSKPLTTLEPSHQVEPITGQMHTIPGRFEVTKARDSYQPGDIIYIYSYRTAGWFQIWFNGKMTDEELGLNIYDEPVCKPESETCWGNLTDSGKTIWWIQVKSTDGKTGWSFQPENFFNEDLCI